MNLKTLEGGHVVLPQSDLDVLKSQLKGPLLADGDPGYEDSRTVWNGMIDRRPALVVRCLGTADVIACVRFARERNITICIKGGGHNIAGLATADDALMLDLSMMRGVFVDRAEAVAHAQAGCQLGDVDRETQVHGLATVLGFVSQTGIAGLTLGGGFGYLTRRWGYTVDNVVGMDVVTAEGRLVHASEKENPDLFWALCGGGGNFGVVTSIDYRLHEVGPDVVGGIVAWPASEASSVLEMYRDMAANAPRELTLVALMRPAPPAPWLQKEIHGKPIVAILACYSGTPEEGERAVARIKSFGSPVGDVLVRRPYTQLQSLLDATQPKGRRYYWKSEYLPDVTSDFCAKVISQAPTIPSPHTALILFHISGALNEHREDQRAAGNRDARFVLNIGGAWDSREDDEMNTAWVRNAWEDLRSFSTGGTYINFLTEDEDASRVEAAIGQNLARLSRVKARWDPANTFRVNRNIEPDMAAVEGVD